MPTPRGKTVIEVKPEDRDRLNQLARHLTDIGPGRFGQRDAVKYLLDTREAMELIVYAKTGDETP